MKLGAAKKLIDKLRRKAKAAGEPIEIAGCSLCACLTLKADAPASVPCPVCGAPVTARSAVPKS